MGFRPRPTLTLTLKNFKTKNRNRPPTFKKIGLKLCQKALILTLAGVQIIILAGGNDTKIKKVVGRILLPRSASRRQMDYWGGEFSGGEGRG